MPLGTYTVMIEAECRSALSFPGNVSAWALAEVIDHQLTIVESRLGWHEPTTEDIAWEAWEDGFGTALMYDHSLRVMIDAAKPEDLAALAHALHRGLWLLRRSGRMPRA